MAKEKSTGRRTRGELYLVVTHAGSPGLQSIRKVLCIEGIVSLSKVIQPLSLEKVNSGEGRISLGLQGAGRTPECLLIQQVMQR